jgi:hypothetical protein
VVIAGDKVDEVATQAEREKLRAARGWKTVPHLSWDFEKKADQRLARDA